MTHRMTDTRNITDFERMTALAWPAKESKTIDGWILRANDGVTWRANTVHPFNGLTSITLGKAVEAVMRFYKKRGLQPAFKITSASKPKELDYELQRRGFVKESETHVQITDIDDILSNETSLDVHIEEELVSDWISAFCNIRDVDEFNLKTRLDIMKRIPFPKGFALGILNGNIAGIGLGVLQGEWIALFAIRTFNEYRRAGVATAMNQALARWAKEKGGQKAYLQVEASNTPALSLYDSLGFKTFYSYWYRILHSEN